MSWLPVLTVALAVVAALMLGLFNGLARRRKRVRDAWSVVDVQLLRRNSLLPNLVGTVEGYAAHEQELFEEVARARCALQQGGTAGQIGRASYALTAALGHLLAVVERYPTLHASEHFVSLRINLSDLEEKIAVARQFYNRDVLRYNTRLERFPASIVARLFAFRPAEFFEAESQARTRARVTFSKSLTDPNVPAPAPFAS